MSKVKTIFKVFRGDFRHLPKVAIFTILSISLYNFGWGVADPFFSLYLAQFSDQYTVIGFYRTLAVVAGVLVLIPLGDLLDRVSHSRLIDSAKCGYVVIGLCYFLAGEYLSVPLLVFALLLNGALMPVVWTGTAATLRDYSDKKDAALTFGFFLTARQLLWILGIAASLYIVWKYPIHYVFIPVIIFPVLSILLSRKHLPTKHHEPFLLALKDLVFEDKIIVRFFKEMRGFNSEMWSSYFLTFLSVTIGLIGMAFIPLYAQEIGFSLSKIGVLVLVMNIPFLLSFVAAEIADRSERLRNIIIGFAISSISLGCMSLWHTEEWAVWVFSFLMMAGYAIALPSIDSITTVLTPKKYTGTGSALNDLFTFLSVMIFSPVIGYLIDALNWQYLFYTWAVVIGGLMAYTAVLQYIFKKRNLLYHINHPDSKNDPYII